MVVESIDGSGISPYTYSQNSLSLVVGMWSSLLIKDAGTLHALEVNGYSIEIAKQLNTMNNSQCLNACSMLKKLVPPLQGFHLHLWKDGL